MNDINDSNIMQWVERFLDGSTTCAEEQKLYEYFSQENISPEARPFQEMMKWYASEMTTPILEHKKKRSFSIKRWIYTISIAASIALLCTLGIKLYDRQSVNSDEFSIYEGSYIIRNGEKITDLEIIMTELILVASHKALERINVRGGKPAHVVICHLKKEGKVLSKARLVHILAVLEEDNLTLAIDKNGHISSLIGMLKEVDNTALLILKKVCKALTAVVKNYLSCGNVCKPGIPVPKLIGIGSTGHNKGVLKASLRFTRNPLVCILGIFFN